MFRVWRVGWCGSPWPRVARLRSPKTPLKPEICLGAPSFGFLFSLAMKVGKVSVRVSSVLQAIFWDAFHHP